MDRKVILYVAISLDGFIADESGGVSWIEGHNKDNDSNDSYKDFIKKIDIIIMGSRTYDQIINELSPKEWIYEGTDSYVVSREEREDTSNVKFIKDACEFVKNIKRGNIWVLGGAELANTLLKANLINEIELGVIPILLGKGIRLFGEYQNPKKLHLNNSYDNNGIVTLKYSILNY